MCLYGSNLREDEIEKTELSPGPAQRMWMESVWVVLVSGAGRTLPHCCPLRRWLQRRYEVKLKLRHVEIWS
jgi:hypothetical protein